MALKDKRVLFISLISAGVVLAVAILALIGGWLYFSTSAPTTEMVYIYPNATTKTVHDSLAVKFGDAFADKTMKLVSMSDVKWSSRIGAYKIEKGTNSFRAMRKITRGAQTPVKLTFNNLRTLQQLADRIGGKFLMSGDEFTKALNNSQTLQKMNCDTNNVRVIFFPDTYEFYWNITPEKLIDEFYSYYEKWWDKEGRRAKASSLGLSPQQVSIVASIVEEETNDKAERGMVARLYMNRLQNGMKLQADPTVKFALQDFSLRRISGPILFTNSPYNTYKFAGLPPGPIRLPEKATIEAVLNAPQHNYVYMCAKEDFSGRHNFTTSYAEHMANAKKYQDALNKRGIN